MRLLLLLSITATALAAVSSSPKRGLVFTPNDAWPQDNQIWAPGTAGGGLTWYYNYQASPSSAYSGTPQSSFEFVPMLWGYISDRSFFNAVNALVQKGTKITHILTFNEPDGPLSSGGSNISPALAAAAWANNIAPLQALLGSALKVGLPACTGGRGGIPWLRQFLGNCSQTLGNGRNCTYDFVPLHWYGDFESLASHIGEYSAAFPNTPIWITEAAYEFQDLPTTQAYFNQTTAYLDRLDSVERYSLFGAFRSEVSNVGPNAAFLNNAGRLADMGSWYLGRPATGLLPTSGGTSSSLSSSLSSFVLAAAAVGAAWALW